MRIAGVLVLALAAVLGCAPAPERPAAERAPASSAAAAAGPADGDTLVRRLEGEPKTLNYVMFSSTYEEYVLGCLYDYLIYYDEKLDFVPGLAERWEVSPDLLTYTFHLRPTATFDDGHPVTAEDLQFTLERIVDPKSEAQNKSSLFMEYERCEIVDPHTVRVKFKRPYSGQLQAFRIAVMPKHVWGKGDFTTHAANRKPVGNGPYRFVKWDSGQTIELEKRKDYAGGLAPGHFDRIVFRILEEDATALAALESQEIDETRLTSSQWRESQGKASFSEHNRVEMFYELSYNFISMNNRSPFFKDARVRRAMAMFFDRATVIDKLYFGTAKIISGPLPPDSWGYNPRVPPLGYDPEQGKRLLAEAGWKDTDRDGILDKNGKPFAFEFLVKSGNKVGEQYALILKDELARAGVTLTPRRLDWGAFMKLFDTGDFEMASNSWTLTPDPDDGLYALWHSSQKPPNGYNVVFFENAEVDKLLDEARLTFDREERRTRYHRIHEIMAQEQPYVFLMTVKLKWGLNKRLRDVKASPLGLWDHYPAWRAWWVPRDEQLRKRP